MNDNRSQSPPLPPPPPAAPGIEDPHQLRDLPRDIVGMFARWIGVGALVGAVALGIAGLWYLGVVGLVIGAVLGVIIGGIAGLLLLFTLNWPF